MIRMVPYQIDGMTALGVEVKLPKTTLLSISTEVGYIMCGALDVGLLNAKLADRAIVAGRAVGVRTLEQLLEAPLEAVTTEAERRGIHVGMRGADALRLMR
ncbi:DUF1805 domain-containing protein [Paenibacillus sp. IB182496]|uniref:DUF1805 domain-containing protein n=1 Tax=Paenibacillus sabuli TaxID=2772509 RepID=A0A927BZA1_9BACL|nr:DUF1805 domain-containing protein [Paenibacillus sabuli]MBD2848239.1 DUF1805 domain-containing protein [Paenibacillus sabuli]